MFSNTILYTRAGCHLCDDALAVLRTEGLRPTIVDVDDDDALREKFNECVPVVEIDGKVRFRGRVDPMLLRRLLAVRNAQTQSSRPDRRESNPNQDATPYE